MSDTRHRNVKWIIKTSSDGTVSWDQVQAALLMDLRDELQTLNAVLRCPNFQEIPSLLRAVKRNTAKKKKRK